MDPGARPDALDDLRERTAGDARGGRAAGRGPAPRPAAGLGDAAARRGRGRRRRRPRGARRANPGAARPRAARAAAAGDRADPSGAAAGPCARRPLDRAARRRARRRARGGGHPDRVGGVPLRRRAGFAARADCASRGSGPGRAGVTQRLLRKLGRSISALTTKLRTDRPATLARARRLTDTSERDAATRTARAIAPRPATPGSPGPCARSGPLPAAARPRPRRRPRARARRRRCSATPG